MLDLAAMRSLVASLLLVTACGTDAPSGGACPSVDGADAGDLSALKANRCNVPGSMGNKNWYKLAATLPDGAIVQVELWPFVGAFTGGAVHTGTFTIAGDELGFQTCGVCLRAMADKGKPTQREYFATAGTVEVTAVGPDEGAQFIATVQSASFAEVSTDRTAVADGCTMDLDRVKVTGAVVPLGGTGGGGGGGGGSGNAGCKLTIGD